MEFTGDLHTYLAKIVERSFDCDKLIEEMHENYLKQVMRGEWPLSRGGFKEFVRLSVTEILPRRFEQLREKKKHSKSSLAYLRELIETGEFELKDMSVTRDELPREAYEAYEILLNKTKECLEKWLSRHE